MLIIHPGCSQVPASGFSATQGGPQHLGRGEDARTWEDSPLGILLPVWVPLSLQGTLSVLHSPPALDGSS